MITHTRSKDEVRQSIMMPSTKQSLRRSMLTGGKARPPRPNYASANAKPIVLSSHSLPEPGYPDDAIPMPMPMPNPSTKY